jgi:drug/metabolite transporter (DMT)-like permease
MRWKVALSGLAASWGFIAVLVSAVSLGAGALAFLRLAIAAATLGLIAALGRQSVRPGTAFRALVLLGVLQAAHWVLFFEAVKLGSVALAVLTFYTAPILLGAFAPMFLPERTSRIAIAALPVGAVGIGLVAISGDDGGSFSLGAVAAGLGSAVTFAALVVVSKRLLDDGTPPLTVAFWDCVVGAIALSPALLFVDRIVPSGLADWSSVLALGVVFTGLSTLVYAVVLRHVTAQAAGILTFLEPVAAVILAAIFLDDSITLAMLVGGALVIVAGIAVVVLDPPGDGASPSVPAEAGTGHLSA